MDRRGDLGVVETIYEEDDEFSVTSPSDLSPSDLSPSPLSLHSRVDAWSQVTGQKANILIDVGGLSFKLHKDRLTWRSGYFKRQLTDSSAIILSLPLNITAKTFALVADFCYLAQPVLTPFNITALRVAADLLEMTEDYGDGNLLQIAEDYFCHVIAVNRDYASIVFRSCLLLLPEAETTAFLASRCIEALCLTDGCDSVLTHVDSVKTVKAEDFLIIAESMNHRFTRSHDILYRIVDNYIKTNKEKIRDGEKEQLCNTIDCTKLSPENLLHSFQNPRMPLRFIIRSMFIHTLHTRRTVISSSTTSNPQITKKPENHSIPTLGAVLQRDAAIRQVEQLTEAMDATSWRIQSLERELIEMKKKLIAKDASNATSVRSASFRLSTRNGSNKVDRNQRGSVSSSNMRFDGGGGAVTERENGSSSSSDSMKNARKKFGRRFVDGIKGVFGL